MKKLLICLHFINALICERKFNANSIFPLFNHIDVLLHKVSPEFMILSFHDFPKEPKISKCRDSLYHLCLTFQKALGITAQSKTGEKAKHGKL